MKARGRFAACALLALGLALGLSAGPAPQDPAAPTPTFAAYDVYVDAGAHALGAFQFAWLVTAGRAQIVGIEGGDGVFAPAPYYDAAALHGGRVLVGAFATAGERPHGRARVARVHLMIEAGPAPQFAVRLQAVADDRGDELAAKIEWQRTESKR